MEAESLLSRSTENPSVGLYSLMPTILSIDGFVISIRLPPREHGPPHVHVWKGGQHVVISLGDAHVGPALRDVPGMNKLDVARALRIVESHQEFLVLTWRRLHG